jgi:hypothetical protein
LVVLLLQLLLLVSCAAVFHRTEDDDGAEWGIFSALRRAQSGGDTSSCCSCCEDVLDLRERIAALERHVAQLTGHFAKPSTAAQCPAVPDAAAASAAAESAAPALAKLQASYCSEWVRSKKHLSTSARHLAPSSAGSSKRRWSVPAPAANLPGARSALVRSAAVHQRFC